MMMLMLARSSNDLGIPYCPGTKWYSLFDSLIVLVRPLTIVSGKQVASLELKLFLCHNVQ
jgi:hypothetical protein